VVSLHVKSSEVKKIEGFFLVIKVTSREFTGSNWIKRIQVQILNRRESNYLANLNLNLFSRE
jgi:hypothetical protein